MAIKVLNRGNNTSTDLTLLYNFLLENQNGTFLENMTISYDTSTTPPELTIVSANGTTRFRFKCDAIAHHSGSEVTRYTTNGYYYANSTYASANTRYCSCYLKAVILCRNGLIFHFRGGYNWNGSSTSSNTYTESVGIALTVDNHGELAYLKTTQYLPADTSFIVSNNYWYAISSTSSTGQQLCGNTRYGSNRTCLAPIATAAQDPDEYLPYAYVATASQLASEGLTAVRINGVDYITNGTWYIRDTPIE